MQELAGKKVALLVCEGFDQVAFAAMRDALLGAGAVVDVVSPLEREVRGCRSNGEKGEYFPVNVPLKRASADEYDALALPGGRISQDELGMDSKAVAFARQIVAQDKPVAAIGRGASILIEAGVLSGKQLTSCPSLRADLVSAGADWIDEGFVKDGCLVTGRGMEDLDAFNARFVACVSDGDAGRGEREAPSPALR